MVIHFIISALKEKGLLIDCDKHFFKDFHNDSYRQDEQVILNILFVNDSKSTNVESLKLCL